MVDPLDREAAGAVLLDPALHANEAGSVTTQLGCPELALNNNHARSWLQHEGAVAGGKQAAFFTSGPKHDGCAAEAPQADASHVGRQVLRALETPGMRFCGWVVGSRGLLAILEQKFDHVALVLNLPFQRGEPAIIG
jgi:hypothetical protein